MSKLFSSLAITALVGAMFQPNSALALEVNPKIAQQVSLDSCKTESERDCITFFGTIEGSSAISAAEYSHFESIPEYFDESKNLIRRGFSHWQAVGIPETYAIDARLETPRNITFAEYGIRAGALRIHIHKNDLDFSTKVVLKIRTSWLRPVNSNLYAADASMSYKKIEGGYEWTFVGKRNKVFEYEYDKNRDSKIEAGANADFSRSDFKFIVDHGVKGEPAFYDTRCVNEGFPATATNAPWGGMPYWNAAKKSLDFNIGSPHADTDGNLIFGYFTLYVAKSYIDCAWPGLNSANGFNVSVVSSSGERQVATTVASLKKGIYTINAYNFHYSTPTIRITAKKRATITCLSESGAKKTKLVSGYDPKCPSGFKKK